MILIALMLICLISVIPVIVWFPTWAIGLHFHKHIPFAPYGYASLLCLLLCLSIAGYGTLLGRFHMEVTRYEFVSEAVPQSLDGYKIVHISDWHLSTFNAKAAQRVVDSINAQEPDIVCFTGDLVTSGVSEAEPYTDILRSIRAKDGVYSVFGNHDFLIYMDTLSDSIRNREVQLLETYVREKLGWHLLRNEHVPLHTNADLFCVIGCDNASYKKHGFHTVCVGDLEKAMQGSQGFRMLLTHDPTHWRAEVAEKQDIPLTLSGHTHAGQMRMFGLSLSSILFAEDEGWYYATKNDSIQEALYINRGLGCTLPLRINCPEEITVITLRQKH